MPEETPSSVEADALLTSCENIINAHPLLFHVGSGLEWTETNGLVQWIWFHSVMQFNEQQYNNDVQPRFHFAFRNRRVLGEMLNRFRSVSKYGTDFVSLIERERRK